MPFRLKNLLVLFSLFYFYDCVICSALNITADDEGSNPSGSHITYLPSNASWVQGNQLPNFAGIDISKPWATTWHNASSNASSSILPSINFTFSGVAVYIYNTVQRAFQTNLTMTLDGVESGTYQNPLSVIDSPNDTTYWQIVYAVTGLENTQHTLIVALDDLRNSNNPYNLFLFDRAVYTWVLLYLIHDLHSTNDSVSDPPSSTSNSSQPSLAISSVPAPSSTPSISPGNHGLSAGAEVGIAVGSAAVAALSVVGVIYFMKRRRLRKDSDISLSSEATPWDIRGYIGRPHGSNGSHADRTRNRGIPTIENSYTARLSSYATSGHASYLAHSEAIPTYGEVMRESFPEDNVSRAMLPPSSDTRNLTSRDIKTLRMLNNRSF